MAVVEYLPVATAVGANVDTQANFAGSDYQQDGFVDGIALPYQANKIWRQTSVIAAMIATWISQTLNADVRDDGNLPALMAQWISAWGVAVPSVASGATLTQSTPPLGDNSNKVANTAFIAANSQPRLGFTPVQQGTGIGQGPNGVKIGWSSTGLLCTVDVTNMGAFVFEAELDGAIAIINGNVTTAQNSANAAQGTANTALGNAAAAQGSANTALAEIAALNVAAIRNDVTGSRAFGVTYVNSSGGTMYVAGYGNTQGSNVGSVQCVVNGDGDFANTVGATVDGGACGFSFTVPSGSSYSINANNLTGGRNGVTGVGKWIETIVKL